MDVAIGGVDCRGDAEYEEEELEMAEYKGVGILLQRVDGVSFKRTGAVVFESMSHATWVQLRRVCCKGKWDAAAGQEHDLDEGQEFVLQ